LSLLPAYIEIVLAAGDVQDARIACRELEGIARSFDTGVPGAITAHMCGAVALAEGDAQAALGVLLRRIADHPRFGCMNLQSAGDTAMILAPTHPGSAGTPPARRSDCAR
jgi:hypothetical protein